MIAGTNEEIDDIIKSDEYVKTNERLYEAIISSGYPKEKIKFALAAGGEHNENSWNEQFPDMLEFFFKNK